MIATNEELALLEKWKRKLCLQEWRIKLLTHLHPEEMMVRNAAGCTECILVFRYILGKRLAFVLAVCDNALTVLMAGQLPALSYLICV